MERTATKHLMRWLESPRRKPMVLRGARQVGKTWLVRDLAAKTNRKLVELNFEEDPSWRHCFSNNNPKDIIGRIGLRLEQTIEPDSSLLLLDEIQAYGEGLAKLRWFAEKMPNLPVIAAGSLLEFSLRDHSHSMPVGRVVFYNLGPFGFDEYLKAHNQKALLNLLNDFRIDNQMDPVAHQKASSWLERFSMTGGMPGIVLLDVGGDSSESIRDAQRQLTATYRADFPKYSGRIVTDTLDAVLLGAANQLGQKFVYSKVNPEAKYHQVKAALELLASARVCRIVNYSAGNRIPLFAEIRSKFRKVGLLDISLLHALIDTPAKPVFPNIADLVPSLRSRFAEQLIIQQLGLLGSRQGDPMGLFYWQREGGRPGEIDHLVQMQGRIIPIELKSGAAGSMKSLHQFMYDKNLKHAVRIDQNPPSLMNVDVKTTQSDKVDYSLSSIPQYLLFNLEELLG